MVELAMNRVFKEDNGGQSLLKYDLKSQMEFDDNGGASSAHSIMRRIIKDSIAQGF